MARERPGPEAAQAGAPLLEVFVVKKKKPRLRVVHRRLAEIVDAQTDLEVEYAVGFYSMVFAGVDNGKVMMHGSGTLVRVNGRGCFLTAHHVVYGKGTKRGLLHFDGLCVCLSRQGQQPIFPRDIFVGVPIAVPSTRAGEPDLGALLLPPHVELACASYAKAFYDLDRRPPVEPEDVAASPGRLIVFAGAPAEYTTDTPEGRTSKFLLGYGRTIKVQRRHGFSYISLRVSYGPEANPPRSFQGMSGGGVWVVPTRSSKGEPARVDGAPTLIGVGFRQIARKKKVTSVRCHGSWDIYERARNEITKAIKNQPLWKGPGTV